mmetsp:Transcript_36977/g.81212  ORF Transcript_36977/g.81212 Transcript_36977/m.81212 type:complete len:249 (-) Transcript_36977:78-824(-)|eukprot:CAMPEP_0170599762 /NCGR_PEP_ID=MMETSP0224-20130122/16976_1 /TAXON_ID=285029 /ORGANISM="Togula jolla, Strain CCCM 725" /LENGTH=248 /DNA_ID=CAMNT_0010924447 /DNA_START=89 /DNA_END=835 /DNA_ORIENTATION=+
MAFRGDVQGGQHTALTGGYAAVSQGGGVEKHLRWKIFFFGGAICTLASAIISVFYYIFHAQFAPCAFMSQIFLLGFGMLMIMLDFPFPHPSPHLQAVRAHCFKFVLFMTRFTGRGMWYLFLGSLVYVSLVDEEIAVVVGLIFVFYLVCLGVFALVKGIHLSRSLHRVQQDILNAGRGSQPEQYFPRGQNLSKEQFKALIVQNTNRPDLFTDDEYDFIINALAFKPRTIAEVTPEEWMYWMSSGAMLMV